MRLQFFFSLFLFLFSRLSLSLSFSLARLCVSLAYRRSFASKRVEQQAYRVSDLNEGIKGNNMMSNERSLLALIVDGFIGNLGVERGREGESWRSRYGVGVEIRGVGHLRR